MPRKMLMSWTADLKRWRKTYNKKQYVVFCSELNLPQDDWTQLRSYKLANQWWTTKRAEIDRSEIDHELVERTGCMSELNYRQRTTLMLRNIKLERGCKICGYKEHWAALDFHHINEETKFFNIAERKDLGQGKLLDEIKKCDVLCANCHRSLTHGNM